MLAFLAFLYSLTTIIIRMSAFVNVVLIVARTINITKPFYHINKKGLFISFFVVLLILLPLTIYEAVSIWQMKDFYSSKISYIFKPFLGDYCTVDLYYAIQIAISNRSVLKFTVVPMYVTLIVNGGPLILEVVIALSCLAVNAVVLNRTPPGGATKQRRDKENHITITITILTITFAVCTSIYTIYLAIVTGKDALDFYEADPMTLQWTYVTSTIFPFICSSLNPIILIARSDALTQSVCHFVHCYKSKETRIKNSSFISTDHTSTTNTQM